MILIYRVTFLAVMYLAVIWLVLRYAFPAQYSRLLAAYRGFEQRIEQADTDVFFRWADQFFKVLFVTVASAFAGLLIAGVIAGALHLAR